MSELIELRKKVKSKMPRFTAQDIHKKKRIRKRWRRPRGLHSKMRLNKKGYRRGVAVGYGSPKAVKGLHKSGLGQNLVLSVKELDGLDQKTQGVIVSGKVGLKKKLDIIKKAKELGLTILNIKDADGYLKLVNEKIEKKKAEKAKTTKTKEDKKKQLEAKAKEKEEKEKKDEKKEGEGLADKIESSGEQEEKEKKEKEKKDKVLTKKM